ncbi:hypothetical protein LQZ18_09355 [Lachnospiraceae bacterium ZAX-1]
MQGLRKQESKKFEKFVGLIQDEADKKGSIFFADCEEGHDLEINDMELSDLSGWLIPANKSVEFEGEWDKGFGFDENETRWDEFYTFAEWKLKNDKVVINFNNYDTPSLLKEIKGMD